MFQRTLKNSIFNFNKASIIRTLVTSNNSEALEPVKLSYATYDNASSGIQTPTSPMIVMHGLFGSKSNWNSLCKVYQQKILPQRKIIALDSRNHGDSPHNEHHTYAHLAADLKAILADLNLNKVVLMGHSMGGRCAMLFALKYPEQVERLIVADISPSTDSPGLLSQPKLMSALENVAMPSGVSMSKARKLADEQLQKFVSDKQTRDFLLTNLVPDNSNSYKWRINLPILISSFNGLVRFPVVSNDMVYEGPTLFVGGSSSDYIPFFKRLSYQGSLKDSIYMSYVSYESTTTIRAQEPFPLLVLHGLLDSKNSWKKLCNLYHQKTNPKRRIFAVDLRNHGDTLHHRFNTYEHLVQDVKQFLRDRSLKKVSLIGHSLGGRTAMLFSLKYPDLVEKLVVADISPISTSRSFKIVPEVLSILNNIPMPKNVPLFLARDLIKFKLNFIVNNKNALAILLANLVPSDTEQFKWRINIPDLINNFEHIGYFPDLHNVSFEGPVLFTGGTKSDFIQQTDLPKIKKLFPKAELSYIDGAGHWLHAEKPKEFLNITLDFLNKSN